MSAHIGDVKLNISFLIKSNIKKFGKKKSIIASKNDLIENLYAIKNI